MWYPLPAPAYTLRAPSRLAAQLPVESVVDWDRVSVFSANMPWQQCFTPLDLALRTRER